jgi:hypothetical protein
VKSYETPDTLIGGYKTGRMFPSSHKVQLLMDGRQSKGIVSRTRQKIPTMKDNGYFLFSDIDIPERYAVCITDNHPKYKMFEKLKVETTPYVEG